MPKTKVKAPKQSAHHLTKWLWTGTAVFAAMIVLIWGWNLKVQISNISWKNSSEAQMVAGAKIQINDIVAETKDKQASLDQAKWQIKDLINQLTATSSTSTVPSSTILTATSSFDKLNVTSTATSSVGVSSTKKNKTK